MLVNLLFYYLTFIYFLLFQFKVILIVLIKFILSWGNQHFAQSLLNSNLHILQRQKSILKRLHWLNDLRDN